MLILVGRDDALLEGLTQLLAGGGHRVRIAHSVGEAEELAGQDLPLLVVVDRALLGEGLCDIVTRIPLAPGGAIVLYRTTSDAAAPVSLAHGLARLTLADLELPLERQRLAALAQYVGSRARNSGRVRFDTPPRQNAP